MSAPPTTRFDGKVALVTGSGRGMGRQNAIELASRGADLIINYSRAAGPADAVVAEIQKLGRKAIAIKADVSKPQETAAMFKQAMEHYGHLDIVVSNSGVESFGHISEITPEEFDRVFSVNTRGQLFVAQQAYEHLTDGGRLIMLSSISAQARGIANHAIYSGSKGAVEAFARCLAVGRYQSMFFVTKLSLTSITQTLAARISPSMQSLQAESKRTCTQRLPDCIFPTKSPCQTKKSMTFVISLQMWNDMIS